MANFRSFFPKFNNKFIIGHTDKIVGKISNHLKVI